MKSLYESIKNIMEGGSGGAAQAQAKNKTQPAVAPKPAAPKPAASSAAKQPAPGSPAAKSQERGQAIKDFFKGDSSKASAATVPAPKASDSGDAAKPGTWGNPRTLNPVIAKNREMVAKQQATGVNQPSGRAGPGSYDPAPGKNKTDAAQISKPGTSKALKAPAAAAATTVKKPETPAAAPTSNDAPKPAATDASSLAKAQGKETETKAVDTPKAVETPKADPTDNVFSGGSKVPTMQKRASILPADTIQKNLDRARKNLDNMMGNDDEDKTPVGLKSATTPQGKQEEPEAPKEASKTEKPAASDKDYSTGRPADKELDDKYGKGNTRTDADGRTYVRQKGVMGGPDTENRSYASIGDFVNKIRGKGDVNGKVTAKEAYVNKTFGVSRDLVADIMEVMKKKESSTPRTDKEQDLAAHYGDPKRITHGDVLVARGVIKPKKVEEGTMRNGKYVDDAPRPGTNEVPSPDEGYRGVGKPLYTPVDSKKSGKKSQSTQKESMDVEEDNIQEMSSKMKMKLGLYNKKKTSVKENKDTPGNSYEHQCAIHVKSESFGEGRTVTTQHAEPDHDGYIAWYDVMFEHGIEKYVPTSDLEILVSEMHMHSKRKKTMREDAATDRAENDARTEKALAKMRQRNAEGKGFNVSSDEDQKQDTNQASSTSKPAASAAEPAKTFEPGVRNAVGIQGQATNVAGADALTGGSSTTQAAATPKPAAPKSDAMDAISGGSIGTSQMSYSNTPRDAKQGIAANAPAARVVSTSDGAKEAGYTQPNQRISSFKSNARAREQAAGAAGVAAPMPGGGGKTIAQARQEAGGKPVAGTPSADAAAKQNMAGNAPAARVVSKQDQAYPQGDKTVGNYDYKNKQLAANPSGSGNAPVTRQASSVPAPQPVESPEEKARKAAAQKKPALATSYQGQGMVGTDY
jgi:hypothetical protein